MTRRPTLFLLIALALLLAPLGICLGGGPAMAATGHDSAMHHGGGASGSHHGQGSQGQHHYCPDCQAPSFVKAGKVATSDLAPLNAAVAAVILARPILVYPTRVAWARGLSTPAPPLRRAYRIRLQI